MLVEWMNGWKQSIDEFFSELFIAFGEMFVWSSRCMSPIDDSNKE